MNILRSATFVLLLVPLSAGALHPQMTVDEAFDTCKRLFASNAQIDDETRNRSNGRYVENRDIQEAQTPLGTTTAAPPLNIEVSLSTGEQDGRGIVSYTHRIMDTTGLTRNLSLQASVPFDKSQGQATFASLEGISGDYVVSGAWTQSMWDLEPEKYGEALCQVCRDRAISDLTKCNLTDLVAPGGINEVESQAIQDKLFGRVTSKFFGGESSFGRRERTFFTPAAAKDAEDRPGYSLAIFGGLRGNTWSLNGRVSGKRDYQEGSKATLCSVISSGGLETCNTLPLGEAKKVESLVATLESRFFFGRTGDDKKVSFRRFAIAPSAQYDFESDIWALNAPIFFTRNSKGEFTGGLKLGWRSDENDVSLAVIVARGFLQ